MSITVYKTFSAGEILTASDLNASFSQIVDNGEDLAWPATQSRDFNGVELILDANADSSITADTDDQIDFRLGGSDLMRMLVTSSMGEFRVIGNDAGAGVGPFIVLDRASASPAASDVLGQIVFRGRDSGTNETAYAQIQANIVDPTDSSEDGSLDFKVVTAGSLTTVMTLVGTSFGLTSTDAGATADPILTLDRNSASPADSDVLGEIDFVGRDDGANSTTYASIRAVANDVTDTTEDGQLEFQVLAAGATSTPVTIKANALSIVSTDAGATANPFFEFYRNSASPADSDQLGQFDFLGNDDGLNSTAYASIYAEALDVTDGTEDGQLKLKTMVAGTATLLATVDGNGFDILTGDLRKSSVDYPYQPAKQTTTSGTSFTFGSIPSWAKKITVIWSGVGLSGTDNYLVQLGTSGGFVTSGYVAGSIEQTSTDTTNGFATSTTGMIVKQATGAGALYGHMILTKLGSDTNIWISSHNLYDNAGTDRQVSGSAKLDVAGTLTQIKILTTGSNTFDAGFLGILVE